MAFSKTLATFFGDGYSFASNAISLRTAGHATGTVGPVVTATEATNTLTAATSHGLAVGDRVRFTGADLPLGLVASTDYWVSFVGGSTALLTFRVSATKGGGAVDITDEGTGTHTVVLMGLLDEVTTAMADPAETTTQDWRKVVNGIMEMLYQKWTRTPAADRPTKLTIAKSSGTSNGSVIVTYSVRVVYASSGVDDLADEGV